MRTLVSRTIFRAVVFTCPIDHFLIGEALFFPNFLHLRRSAFSKISGQYTFYFYQGLVRDTICIKAEKFQLEIA